MKHIVWSLVLLIVSSGVFGQSVKGLNSFESIKANGKFELRIIEDDTYSIEIKTEKLDLTNVNFKVEKGQLVIKPGVDFPKDGKVLIEVKCQDLEQFTASKGVKAYSRDTLFSDKLTVAGKSGSEVDLVVKCDTLIAKVNKGAFMRLAGKANCVILRTATGGDFRATELKTNSMIAKLSGGSAEVSVEEFIDVKANLKGKFSFVEQPNKITKKASLGGRVGKLDDF